ncbi:MAG TPA: hypothetical protein VFB58_07245 [Chloroflexota bacterium]|nr:hypothetical protein [Chloroflexota bacterium]
MTHVAHHNLVLAVHQGLASTFLLYSLVLGLWGLLLYARGGNPSGGYLGALILDEALAAVQGLVGVGLLAQGHHPHDPLHYLYGFVAVAAIPAAYFYGQGGHERKDSLIFGLAGLFLAGISIRAMTTGGG